MIILLADDEKLVRLGIKNMIEEIEPHTHTFIEARNGKQLVNVFNETKPDLAFVDINMPLMDGLSAIESCKESSTNTRWFILTGEKEFHLAKKAISLGVNDYLLKPISIDELKPIICNTKNSKKEYLIKDNDSFELNVISTYNKFFAKSVVDNKYCDLNKDYIYTPYLFSIDGLINIDNISVKLDEILSSIREFMTNKLDDNLRFAIHYIDPNNLLLLVRSNNTVCIDFNSLLSSLQDYDCSITLSVFGSYDNELYFYKDLETLKEYAFVRVLENFKGVIHINDRYVESKKDYILFSRYIYKLCEFYLGKEELLYNEYLSKIKESSAFRNVYDILNNSYLNDFLYLNIGFNFDTSSSFFDFIKALEEHGTTIFKKSNKSCNDDLVYEIMRYVNDNYMNDIGVNTIAFLYNITPNYLSKLFHEKAGIKLMDYITSVRIREGKKLLIDSSLSIKDIAHKIGYNSSSRFSKQFVKYEGLTPSEFTKSINSLNG